MRIALLVAVAVVGVATAMPMPLAHACSGSVCAPDFFLPFEGSVPSNTFGIQWWPGKREGVGGDALHETEPSELTFRCSDDQGATHDVAFTVIDASSAQATTRLIVPSGPLVVGDDCEIAVQLGACESGIFAPGPTPAHLLERATFTVTESEDQPSVLGTLIDGTAMVQSTTLSTLDGSCNKQVDVCGVALQLDLHPSIAPWADSLMFTTYVDDVRWGAQGDANAANPTGGSFVGRGRDLVFIRNDDTEGAGLSSPGLHTIQIRANLVGVDTDLALETQVIHVNIDCDSEPGDGSMTKPKASGGCSITRATTSTARWMFLVVLGALAIRRVRSSRATLRPPRARG